METLNQMASTAVRAVWGGAGAAADEDEDHEHPDSHREPISGASGVVARGEPYDAGNMDDEAQRKVERQLSQSETQDPAMSNPDAQPTVIPGSHAEGLGERKVENVGAAAAKPTDTDSAKDVSISNHHDEPTSTVIHPPEHAAPEQAKDEPPSQQHEGEAAGPSDAGKHKDKEENGNGGDKAEKQHEHRAGEHYVRTTGLAADGGDFDASKPGAGREADRLMVEKGMKHAEEEEAKKAQEDAHGHGKGKPSLGERIKHKLHKHN